MSWPSGLVHWTQVLVLSECWFESGHGWSWRLCPWARHLTIITATYWKFGWVWLGIISGTLISPSPCSLIEPLFTDTIMVGAPKDFHWLFHLTVPLAAPHVSLLIHILILYLSPKQIPGGTHPVSSHVLPYFGIHYPYPASLPLITSIQTQHQ